MIVDARKRLFDPHEVKRAIENLIEPGTVFEYRALGATLDGHHYEGTVGGYFDSSDALLSELARVSSAKGQYIILNRIDPALHARSHNKLKYSRSGDGTSDRDITRRLWLIVDVDVDRPTNISTTDAEHETALHLAARIRAELSAEGWPDPYYGDSGNGGRLLYRIDLPADDSGIIKRCIEALQSRFGGGGLSVDTTVHNPARIEKLPGTLTCKGDDTNDRPHRMASLIDVPSFVKAVPDELLELLASQAPRSTSTPANANGNGQRRDGEFDLESWIGEHCPEARPKQTPDGMLWVLDPCPWDAGHTGGCAHIIRRRDGILGAGCKHNSCAGKGWRDLRDAKEPGWREKPAGNKTLAKPVEKQRFITIPEYRPFPIELLPPCLSDLIRSISAATGSDPAYAALPALAACASAIGNSRRLKGGNKSGWEVPAILWMVNVGVSGTGKSAPPKLALRPIKRRETKLYRDHTAAMSDYEVELQRYEVDLKQWKGRKAIGDPPSKPIMPRAERCIVGDTTLEALAPILRDNPRGLLLYRDELTGWIGSFDRYAGKGRASADAAQWLSIFDGDTIIIDRKTGGQRIYVPSATISVCGGIQPETLRLALSHEHRASGLAARLLFAHPPRKAKRWSDADIDRDVDRRFDEMLSRLYGLQPTEDENGDPCPLVIEMTVDAKRRYVRFYNDHNSAGVDLTGDMAAAWSKLEQYPLRFALVLHLVRWASGDSQVDPNLVDEASIEAGIELTKWFTFEAERAYAVLDEDIVSQELRELFELIRRRGGTIRVPDLQHACRRYRGTGGAEEAQKDLGILRAAGLGDWSVTVSGAAGGRPAVEFILHESVMVTKPQESQASSSFITVINKADRSAAHNVDALNAMLAEAATDDRFGIDLDEACRWEA